jgi:precorrin-6A/cobalt-precorrin-6A reductase
MPGERVLIIGGTRDARLLATALIAAGFEPVTSMAGVTREPALPHGAVRIGGFGGHEGIAAYVAEARIGAILDAAHPFAVRISDNASRAAALARVPYVHLERPPWIAGAQDRWLAVETAAQAAAALAPGSRVLLTMGRRGLDEFFSLDDVTGVVRMIEPPLSPLPSGWTLLQARPPFAVEDEVALMRREAISVLVTKNSGGPADAKLAAARLLDLPVVMIARPPKPAGSRVSSVEEAVARLRDVLGEKAPSPP